MIYAFFLFVFVDQKVFSFCWVKLDYPGSIVYLSCFDWRIMSKNVVVQNFYCRIMLQTSKNVAFHSGGDLPIYDSSTFALLIQYLTYGGQKCWKALWFVRTTNKFVVGGHSLSLIVHCHSVSLYCIQFKYNRKQELFTFYAAGSWSWILHWSFLKPSSPSKENFLDR